VRTFVAGDCRSDNTFTLSDPSEFSEIQFEAEVVKALSCLFPSYFCGVFGGSFRLDGERHAADLALIHKGFTHWFVVEVELVSHSLDFHVLPQVRCFRFGETETACITSLCNGFPGIDRERAATLLEFVPRSVAVVANRFDPTWALTLKGLDVQLLTVSVFKGSGGRTAHEVEGSLHVARENIGFARYSSIDKSLLLPKVCGLPLGEIQMEDPFGTASSWTVREAGSALWVTKNFGDPALPHGEYIHIVRTFDGRITMKLSGRPA